MLRVAVTVEQSWHEVPGGIARSTVDLLRALSQRDDLSLVGVAARHDGPPDPSYAPPIPVRHMALPRRLLYECWQLAGFPRVERATGPVDVVHDAGYVVPPSRAPLVATVHDLMFLRYPEHYTRHSLAVFRRGLARARRLARLVMCPSRATVADCIEAGLEEARLRLVPWGVDARKVDVERATQVRARYGIERPYVLYCGTIEPRKNLRRVLEAFRGIDRAVDLVLAGPIGWNEDLRQTLAHLDGRARALGWVPHDDLDSLYEGAAVAVYPSLGEGFGFPVLEAMAQGTPVVTSAGGATQEVAGDAAVLVDPLDVGAIADGIVRLLDDETLARELGSAGRERAKTFTWERSGGSGCGRLRGGGGGNTSVTALRVGINLSWLLPGEGGGAEVYAMRVLRALIDEPPSEVELTLFANRRLTRAYADVVSRVTTAVAPVDGGFRPARIAVESTWLPREAKRRGLDLIHHMADVVPLVRGQPSVLTIHDLRALHRPEILGAPHAAYLRARLRPSVRAAAVVTTPTDTVRTWVVDELGADPDRVLVVSAPLFRPAEGVALSDPGVQEPYFLYPATTNPHKNHGTLINAFAKVAVSKPGVTLVLTGARGRSDGDVDAAIERLGMRDVVLRFGHVPARPKLEALTAGAVALVYPSLYEGFGLPLVEAMAAGCPVIASDLPAIREVVGDAGALVEPDDVDAWADAILRVLDDDALRQALVAAGRERARAYTPTETSRRLSAAYRLAAGRG